MNAVRTIFALAVSFVIAGNVMAAEEKQTPEGKRPRQAMMDHWVMLQGLSLTEDQKVKVEVIRQEYAPKFKEVHVTIEGVLTDEQRKARDEAVKAARAAGKRGEEVWDAAKSAVTLTDEQKGKMADARRAMQVLRKEAHEKVMAVLTTEQKEQLKKPHQGMRGPRDIGWRGEMLKCLNLTTEQQAKIDELKKEYAPKFQEARKEIVTLRKEVHEKVLAYLTPEQKEQLQQACPKAPESKPEGK